MKRKLFALLLASALMITGCDNQVMTSVDNTITSDETANDDGQHEMLPGDYYNALLESGDPTGSLELVDPSDNQSTENNSSDNQSTEQTKEDRLTYLAGLSYEEEPTTEINENVPYFTEEEIAFAKNMATNSSLINNAATFSEFSELDELNRTGAAYALLNESLMPGDDVVRGDISSVKPTGWTQARYSWIDNGGWLYNRCHLIAWSLTGEDDNEKNLITGTRYFNTEGMLPYELQVLKYLNANPKNYVMYRSTPIYSGCENLARGVLLEAYSIEDAGKLSFCVYVYNVQPGVDIDYNTGESQMNEYMEILLKGDQS